jgi:hypothetical protein
MNWTPSRTRCRRPSSALIWRKPSSPPTRDEAPRDPPNGRPQHAGHRRQGDDNDEAGDDIVPTTHKLEFLKYDGTDDPLPWLNRCERYFHVRCTPELKRVALVACYLLDDV